MNLLPVLLYDRRFGTHKLALPVRTSSLSLLTSSYSVLHELRPGGPSAQVCRAINRCCQNHLHNPSRFPCPHCRRPPPLHWRILRTCQNCQQPVLSNFSHQTTVPVPDIEALSFMSAHQPCIGLECLTENEVCNAVCVLRCIVHLVRSGQIAAQLGSVAHAGDGLITRVSSFRLSSRTGVAVHSPFFFQIQGIKCRVQTTGSSLGRRTGVVLCVPSRRRE